MTWFAASIVIWSRTAADKDRADGPCHLWERVLMVQADDVDEATRKVTEFGEADAAANSSAGAQEGEATPHEFAAEDLVFMGVRKIREIESIDPSGDPEGMVEVMFSEMEVRSKVDLMKLAAGNDVIVRYID